MYLGLNGDSQLRKCVVDTPLLSCQIILIQRREEKHSPAIALRTQATPGSGSKQNAFILYESPPNISAARR
jgi:hypothetical protein